MSTPIKRRPLTALLWMALIATIFTLIGALV